MVKKELIDSFLLPKLQIIFLKIFHLDDYNISSPICLGIYSLVQ